MLLMALYVFNASQAICKQKNDNAGHVHTPVLHRINTFYRKVDFL